MPILPKIFLSVPFFRVVLERVETRLDEPEIVFVDAWSHQGSCKHILFVLLFLFKHISRMKSGFFGGKMHILQ